MGGEKSGHTELEPEPFKGLFEGRKTEVGIVLNRYKLVLPALVSKEIWDRKLTFPSNGLFQNAPCRKNGDSI